MLDAREPRARYLEVVQPPGLVRQFELLATAPGGVARLRDLILSLAVQGKLVPQVPSDEPVTELLRKINAEKSLLATSGRIQRQRPSPEVQVHEEPFELPLGWAWVRLPQISYDLGQGAPTQAFTYIDVAAIDNERAVVTDAVEVVQAADAPSRARKRVSIGTVIYSTVRPYLKNIAIVEKIYAPSAIVSTAFAVMHPHTGVNAKYLLHYLRSAVFTQFVASKMAGIAYPAINDSSFFDGIVALPPTAEQERIVARIDELLRLCDALEAQGRLEAEQHARLLGTLLGTLTDSSTPEELAANWQRVADHFDLLLDRPEAVDAVEQTILQLAVRGLLVPQDQNDEPANMLLERIRAERDRLIAAGKVKRDKSLPPASEEDPPYELPDGWAWARVGSLGITSTGGTPPTNRPECFGHETPFIGPGQISARGEILPAEKFISELGRFETSIAERGDVLMVCIGGSIGKCGITPQATAFNQQINSIRVLFGSSSYVLAAMTSLDFQRRVLDTSTGSATPIISKGKWDLLLLPVPPAAEQSRIVARVEELRHLCTALRQRLAASQTTQSRLAEALVAEVA